MTLTRDELAAQGSLIVYLEEPASVQIVYGEGADCRRYLSDAEVSVLRKAVLALPRRDETTEAQVEAIIDDMACAWAWPEDENAFRLDCQNLIGAVQRAYDAAREPTHAQSPAPAAIPTVGSRPGETLEPDTGAGDQIDAVREALIECISVLACCEEPAFVDPDHGREVAELGKRIGYGALMSSASASWRIDLARAGLPTGGQFVSGPCHAVVVNALKQARAALSAPRPAPDSMFSDAGERPDSPHGRTPRPAPEASRLDLMLFLDRECSVEYAGVVADQLRSKFSIAPKDDSQEESER